MQILLILFLILCIFSSAFLSASETSLFSLSSMKLRTFKYGKNRREQLVAELLEDPRNLLVTILMLNVLMNILVQNVVSSLFGADVHWGMSVGIPLGLTLIFGEVIPKSVAFPNNVMIAKCVAPFIAMAKKVLGPIRIRITRLTMVISRFFFFYLRKEEEISIEELKAALRTSKEVGLLHEEEAKLVRGYLNLKEDHVKEIMCPRSEILFFDLSKPLEKLVDLFVEEQCTRIPVCDKNLENLLGIMSSSDFFLHQEKIKSAQDLSPFLKKPMFIPESLIGELALPLFYEKEETMMMVIDEYGSISGLITLEDLVEVIVGQIIDRRDEKMSYSRASKDVLIASGKLELTEFEEIFDVHLESLHNMATIGGWLTEQMGDIPKSGEKYVTEQFLFHILASDPNRIRRVYICKLKPQKKKKA